MRHTSGSYFTLYRPAPPPPLLRTYTDPETLTVFHGAIGYYRVWGSSRRSQFTRRPRALDLYFTAEHQDPQRLTERDVGTVPCPALGGKHSTVPRNEFSVISIIGMDDSCLDDRSVEGQKVINALDLFGGLVPWFVQD